MIRKLVVILLSTATCLLGVAPVLAQADYPFKWLPASRATYEEAGAHRWVYATLEEYKQITGKKIGKYNEAPMLRKKVSAGELPPLEQRLPEEPLVVNPFEKVGEYGGVAHTVTNTPRWIDDGLHLDNMEAPLRPNVGLTLEEARPRPNVPNVVKDWELAEDYRSITLHLRKGMKWSDGKPFTADDVLFWYEDVLLNEGVTPAIDRRWKIGGEVWSLKKIDDYTVRINFAVPNSTILYKLATWGPEEMTSYPKHYLKLFHSRYTDKEKLEKMVEKEGFDYWFQLFQEKALHGWSGTSHVPTLSPYILKERSATRIVMERNPYYWKVDTEGNQLPYFDRISIKVVPDPEMQETMTIAGEFDFSWGVSAENYPEFKKNAEKGNYRVLLYPYANRAGYRCVQINQTYKGDLVLRQILRDKRFRQALSLAIDRKQLNELLYYGRARPMPSTVLPVSMFYLPEFDKAYTEHDPEEANTLLDKMGLEWDKNHEYRLRPDGKRLTVTLETDTVISEGQDPIAIAELLEKYWETVGIDMRVKTESNELFESRVLGNEHQMALSGGATTTDDNLFLAPHHYVLWWQATDSAWAPLWVTWYLTDGEKGERPSEDVLKMTKKWEKVITTVDKEERIRIGREILGWAAEEVLTIGLVGMVPGPEIVRKNLRNIPPTGLDGGVAGTALIDYYYPEQFFFEHPLLETQKR